jgi:hypothetical protein
MSATTRLIALIASLWLVIGGALASRHEARAAHFIDDHGVAFHSSRMTGEHTATDSDVHSRDAAPEHDACGIVPALHQAAVCTDAHVDAAAAAIRSGSTTRTPAPTPAPTDVLTIAPKTSPPTTLA